MERHYLEDDLPILEFYFDAVVRRLERQTTKATRKVSRKAVLTTFMRTRNMAETARLCRVSKSLVRQIVVQAVRTAKRRAGLLPRFRRR